MISHAPINHTFFHVAHSWTEDFAAFLSIARRGMAVINGRNGGFMGRSGDEISGEALPSAAGSQLGPSDLGKSQISPRALIIALLLLAATIVATLATLQYFVAQRIPDLTEASLAAAEQLWERAGPRSYVMEIELSGAQPGDVQIEVRDGVVTAMTRDGRSPTERTWQYWTVPGRFNELERELELAEDPQHEMQVEVDTRLRLRCEFDSKYGFPRTYHRAVYGGGPEVFWRVTKFEAL